MRRRQEAFTAADPGGGPDRGLLPGLGPLLVLGLGAAQLLVCGVQRGGGPAGVRVQALQLLRLFGELCGGGVAGLGGGGGQRLACHTQAPLPLGAQLLRLLVGGQRLLLRLPVDVPGILACRRGVLGAAAHGTGFAALQLGGQFGGDAVQPLFLDVEPVGPGLERPLLRETGLLGCRLRVARQLVAQPGRVEPALGGFALDGELFGPGGGFLCRVDTALQCGPGLLPPGEPGFRVLPDLLVVPLLTLQLGALVDEFGQAAFTPACRLQSAQLLGGPAGGRGESGG